MKRMILMIVFVLLLVISGKAQKTKHTNNAVYVGVGAFMISQKNYYKPITEFRPSIYVQYNRVLWKGLGIGGSYAFKRANPNAHAIDGNTITCTEQTHAIHISPNYRFDIKRFNITHYLGIGVCFANFIFPRSLSIESNDYYITQTYSCFMISPGIRLGYDIKNWNVFLSYNYDYFHCDIGGAPFLVIGTWNFPKNFGHHCLHIGVGIKF